MMAVYEIPLSAVGQRFQVTLAGRTYGLRLIWRGVQIEAVEAAPAGPSVVLITDTAQGAQLGPGVTRVGPTLIDNIPGASYSATGTAGYIGSPVGMQVTTYEASVYARRISGSGTAGQLISARYWNGTAYARAQVPMSALPAVGATYRASVRFTNLLAGSSIVYWLSSAGDVGEVAIWGGQLSVVPNAAGYPRTVANLLSGWVLDITDEAGAPLLSGLPLAAGADLLAPYPHLSFGGALLVYTDGTPDAAPTYAGLGGNSRLFFVTGD